MKIKVGINIIQEAPLNEYWYYSRCMRDFWIQLINNYCLILFNLIIIIWEIY
jgi:hypothetical protein